MKLRLIGAAAENGTLIEDWLSRGWSETEMVNYAVAEWVEGTPDERIAADYGVSEVTQALIARDAAGRKKYGTSLDRTDLSATDWLQHMSEELLDGAGYALAAKREIERLQKIADAAQEHVDAIARDTSASAATLRAALQR